MLDVPLVRRALLFSCQFEQIISEVRRNFIILKNPACLFVISQRTLKKIERTVVFVVDQVLKIVLQGHPQLVAIIVLSSFKFAVFIFLVKSLETKLISFPALCATFLTKSLPRMITGCSFF